MGREAITRVEIGGEAGDVLALLESTELILRGDIRRRFPRDRLVNVHVDGSALCFTCNGESVSPAYGRHRGREMEERDCHSTAEPAR